MMLMIFWRDLSRRKQRGLKEEIGELPSWCSVRPQSEQCLLIDFVGENFASLKVMNIE